MKSEEHKLYSKRIVYDFEQTPFRCAGLTGQFFSPLQLSAGLPWDGTRAGWRERRDGFLSITT